MQHNTKWELVTSHLSELAEGPVWDAARNRIIWVDILSGEIHYVDRGSGQHHRFATGQFTGAVAIKRSGGWIAALKDGIASIDNGEIRMLQTVSHLPDNRFNDGKCDPAGRFWAGTMSIADNPGTGTLYALEADGRLVPKIGGVSCSNGLAWSSDNSTLYYVDSPTRCVVAYDYDMATNAISNGRTVITIPEKDGFPDGMTIDSEDMLWIALWDGWKVARYDPSTGKCLYEVPVPVARASSCTFGGPNLDELYITTAREGLSAAQLDQQPLAGALFVVRDSGFRGVEAVSFNG